MVGGRFLQAMIEAELEEWSRHGDERKVAPLSEEGKMEKAFATREALKDRYTCSDAEFFHILEEIARKDKE